jgi:hypothetical protein
MIDEQAIFDEVLIVQFNDFFVKLYYVRFKIIFKLNDLNESLCYS